MRIKDARSSFRNACAVHEAPPGKTSTCLLCMGLFSRLGEVRPYISASSTTPITKTTKPAAVAAANDRSTLSMMPPRYRRAMYPPWLRRARKVSPRLVSEVVQGDV